MPCLPELYYSAEILFRNWLCLTELDRFGSLDTVVSGIHENEEADDLTSAGLGYVFVEPEPYSPLALSSIKRREWVCLIKSHCASWSLESWTLSIKKYLHNMGLKDEPICIACGIKDESAFHLLCDCPSLISLRMRTFSKPILSIEEYEGAPGCLHLHCCDSN
jgi:hypothetical protein